MKKIIAHCGIGYIGAEHEEEIEFDDNVTEEEILQVIEEWADQFIEVWYDEISE